MFLNICFWLTAIGLGRPVAALRRWIAHRSPRSLKVGHYRDPLKVCGWKGWVEHKRLGVLAFIDSEGRLVYKW